MILPEDRPTRRFRFETDTFAYANEVIWAYHFDPITGKMTTFRQDPPPTYSHRCFVMVRSARQFFYHARFEPDQPVAEASTYRRLIREVVSRSPRLPGPEEDRVVVPGYDGLRAFSRAQEPLLKAECGSIWQSYFVRSHWRMVFPIWPGHQAGVAGQLVKSFQKRLAPIVHLFRFPQLTINHGMVLFDVAEKDASLVFQAYDPNLTDRPAELTYDFKAGSFFLPRAHYWGGGKLNVIEAFRGGLY